MTGHERLLASRGSGGRFAVPGGWAVLVAEHGRELGGGQQPDDDVDDQAGQGCEPGPAGTPPRSRPGAAAGPGGPAVPVWSSARMTVVALIGVVPPPFSGANRTFSSLGAGVRRVGGDLPNGLADQVRQGAGAAGGHPVTGRGP